jgi:hypothetical protein
LPILKDGVYFAASILHERIFRCSLLNLVQWRWRKDDRTVIFQGRKRESNETAMR